MNEIQISDWLKAKISSAQLSNDSGFCFIVNTKCLCVCAFKILFGISDYKFQQCISNLQSPTIHGNSLQIRTKPYESILNI